LTRASHALDAVAWLAAHPFASERGVRAGDLIMTGTLTGITPLSAGDEAVGDFGALGEVRARFR
jgi:2-keto-4-pentenoate hydratase